MDKTPETIYLIPGDYDGENGMVWGGDPAPDSYCNPEEAVKYVRSDHVPGVGQETTMFEMREIKCKECGSILGYSDADYVPLMLCVACRSEAEKAGGCGG